MAKIYLKDMPELVKEYDFDKNNDLIKKNYCIDNNIKYLEIPYTEKDNIEQIIKEFFVFSSI